MTVDPNIANTLILAIMEKEQGAVALGNLTTMQGLVKETIVEYAPSALQATESALRAATTIKAQTLLILSNSKAMVNLYTHPIRLPMRRPPNLDDYYNPRGGMYRQGAWNVPASAAMIEEGKTEWEIMRLLCNFDRWQIKYLSEEHMKGAQELWQQHYTTSV